MKTHLICFYDSKGIIDKKFVPQDQTINGKYYLDVVKRLLFRIRRVRPQYCENNSWRLLHDNAPAHRSTFVTNCWPKIIFLPSTIHRILLFLTPCTEGKALCQYWDYIEESNTILKDIHSMRNGNILNKKMIVIVLFLKKFRLFFESLYIKIIDFSFYMLSLFKSLLPLWGRPSELFRNKRIENVHPLQQYPILENIAIGNILQLDFIRSTFSWFKTIRLINGC